MDDSTAHLLAKTIGIPLNDIEEHSGRKIAIAFNANDASGKYHEQYQSPLFSILPQEIRDQIWAYALAPFEDQTRPFKNTEYYYRPAHTAMLKTDIALLLTCRRIWLESNQMAMLQAEHSFYFQRAAPDARNSRWMAALTNHNRSNFGHLHMYVQICAIEGLTADPGRVRRYFLKTEAQPGDFQPRVFHVTLRHTDWWWWESDEPLRLQDGWVQAILDSPDLRSTHTIKLELETLDYKVGQLKPILERIRNLESREFKTHLVNGQPTFTEFVLSRTEDHYVWEGPTNINGQNFHPYDKLANLKYHVTTLTWTLVFPQYPSAFVPNMRRQPRVSDEEVNGEGDSDQNQDEDEDEEEWGDHGDEYYFSDDDYILRHPNQPQDSEEPAYGRMRSQMLDAQEDLDRVSEKTADDTHGQWRGAFIKSMTEILPEKWAKQRSLLYFLD